MLRSSGQKAFPWGKVAEWSEVGWGNEETTSSPLRGLSPQGEALTRYVPPKPSPWGGGASVRQLGRMRCLVCCQSVFCFRHISLCSGSGFLDLKDESASAAPIMGFDSVCTVSCTRKEACADIIRSSSGRQKETTPDGCCLFLAKDCYFNKIGVIVKFRNVRLL